MKDLNLLTSEIIGSAIKIHRKLGPGLNERVYEAVLARLLTEKGFHVERQKLISFDLTVFGSMTHAALTWSWRGPSL